MGAESPDCARYSTLLAPYSLTLKAKSNDLLIR